MAGACRMEVPQRDGREEAGILAFTIVTCLESRIRWARGSCSTRPRTSCAIRCPTAISAPVGQELIRLVARRLTETASRSSRLARARSHRSRVSEPALAARLTAAIAGLPSAPYRILIPPAAYPLTHLSCTHLQYCHIPARFVATPSPPRLELDQISSGLPDSTSRDRMTANARSNDTPVARSA
ncbi:hypothetical protein BMF94_6309 [Rhodotorula taiwanensis]|uniref:Uncharacterized protein n=1 Tax=Rhodotorula taiwanensis TaxID=741276 RepID=A0A2S5B1N0_9BASI|nr:hypothetical protein BMF94_6309 [Rhodotorula taiwanensis]